MNITSNNLLHYLLIILLMFAPLRSVLAEQSAHCDMDDDMSSAMSASHDLAHDVAHDMIHDMPNGMSHDMSQMSSATQTVIAFSGSATENHQCCCCDDVCSSSCDMSVSASLFLQVSSYTPVFINSSNLIVSSSEIIIRTIAPPSRPPALFS